MKISEILRPNDVVCDLLGSDPTEVLAQLCSTLESTERVGGEVMLQALLEREKLGSTGVGQGIAIPHGKVPGLSGLRLCLGRSKAGVDFNTQDAKPAHLFLALLTAPEGKGHLKALARISRLFKSEPFRQSLMAAKDARELHQLIQAEEANC